MLCHRFFLRYANGQSMTYLLFTNFSAHCVCVLSCDKNKSEDSTRETSACNLSEPPMQHFCVLGFWCHIRVTHQKRVGHEMARQGFHFLCCEHFPAVLSSSSHFLHALLCSWILKALMQTSKVLLKQRHPEAMNLHRTWHGILF